MAYMSQEKKKSLAPAIKAILKEYGLNGSLGVEHHTGLVLNIRSGKIDFFSAIKRSEHALGVGNDVKPSGHLQVNTYHIESHFSGVACEALVKLNKAMNVGNHDKSDISTDYFDVGWYVYINIGKWDRPYVLEG